MPRALLITDVQNDFCPGGALPVPHGDKIIPVINKIAPSFDKVIATQDWHPLNHVSFARNHHRSSYEVIAVHGIEQVLWPVHCVPGTYGASLHPELDLEHVDLILRKGTDPAVDSYSVFLDNDQTTETGLRFYLKGLQINELYLCGLTLDYCIYYSAVDARRFGFSVHVIEDACKGLDEPPGSMGKAMADMLDKEVKIINHGQL